MVVQMACEGGLETSLMLQLMSDCSGWMRIGNGGADDLERTL